MDEAMNTWIWIAIIWSILGIILQFIIEPQRTWKYALLVFISGPFMWLAAGAGGAFFLLVCIEDACKAIKRWFES